MKEEEPVGGRRAKAHWGGWEADLCAKPWYFCRVCHLGQIAFSMSGSEVSGHSICPRSSAVGVASRGLSDCFRR
jgi:hypothetical protein